MDRNELGLIEKFMKYVFSGTPIELTIKLIGASIFVFILLYFITKLMKKDPSQNIGNNSSGNIQIGGNSNRKRR